MSVVPLGFISTLRNIKGGLTSSPVVIEIYRTSILADTASSLLLATQTSKREVVGGRACPETHS